MDSFFSLGQFILSVMFLCVVAVGVTAHVILGNINSLRGYVGCAFLAWMAVSLVRCSWKEYMEEKKENK